MPTETLTTTQTTFISSAQPDNKFSFYPLLYVGSDPSFLSCVSFLKYTLPELPVTAVDSALLQLSVIVKTGATPSPVVVNRVTSPLDTATVTYNTQTAFTATESHISVATSDLYTAVQIDVTDIVNGWLSETFTNNGFALTNDDGTTLVEFATNKIVYEPYFPKLILNYSIAPAQPIGGIQAQLQGSPVAITPDNAAELLDTVIIDQSPDISYDAQTGELTLSAAGNYYISWWVANDGSAGPVNIAFSVAKNTTPVAAGYAPIVTDQVSGDALITVATTPVTLSLLNSTGADVSVANTGDQVNISIIKLS